MPSRHDTGRSTHWAECQGSYTLCRKRSGWGKNMNMNIYIYSLATVNSSAVWLFRGLENNRRKRSNRRSATITQKKRRCTYGSGHRADRSLLVMLRPPKEHPPWVKGARGRLSLEKAATISVISEIFLPIWTWYNSHQVWDVQSLPFNLGRPLFLPQITEYCRISACDFEGKNPGDHVYPPGTLKIQTPYCDEAQTWQSPHVRITCRHCTCRPIWAPSCQPETSTTHVSEDTSTQL